MEYVKTTMIDKLLDVLAPHRCSSCGEIGAIFCESCKHDIISESFSQCLFCAKPCGSLGVCADCGRRAGVIQAWCAGERREGLKRLIDAYKFDSSRSASLALVALLDGIIPVLPEDVVIVGIPSAPKTVRARGFSHMDRVVRGFAKRRGLQTARPLARSSQVTLHFLPKSERIRLGPSLFRLSGGAVPETILLLDDIVTTGTTLRSAVKLLREAGAKKVHVAVLARQPDE